MPSSVIDQRGASAEEVDEAEVERRGPSVIRDEEARPVPASESMRWMLAIGTSVAIWALAFSVLHLVRSATEWSVGSQSLAPGMIPLYLLHAEGAQYLAFAAILALGTGIGIRHLSFRGTRNWVLLIAATLVGALVTSALAVELGGVAAVVMIGGSLVWLAVAYQLRPL